MDVVGRPRDVVEQVMDATEAILLENVIRWRRRAGPEAQRKKSWRRYVHSRCLRTVHAPALYSAPVPLLPVLMGQAAKVSAAQQLVGTRAAGAPAATVLG